MINHAELTEANRRIITFLAQALLVEKDIEKAAPYLSDDEYIQHNPLIADGKAAAIEFLKKLFSEMQSTVEIKKIVVDGEMAVIHAHVKTPPGQPDLALMDMFRLRNGKVVEHWDLAQPVPASSANAHPMF